MTVAVAVAGRPIASSGTNVPAAEALFLAGGEVVRTAIGDPTARLQVHPPYPHWFGATSPDPSNLSAASASGAHARACALDRRSEASTIADNSASIVKSLIASPP
jgi:hypothetical protein